MSELSDASVERNVIACCVKSKDAWLEVSDQITSDDFPHPLNAALWVAVSSLYEGGAKVDPVLVVDKLPKDAREELDQLGGWGYIAQLQAGLPINPENVSHEAKKLVEMTTRRRAVSAGEKIAELAVTERSVSKLLDKAAVEVDRIVSDRDEDAVLIGEGAIDWVTERMGNPQVVPGLPSGFRELDSNLQGFQPGELYVVGARKKTGKSILLLNWARHIAVEQGVPVLWITTEHQLEAERTRLLSGLAEVPYASIWNGTFVELPTHVERVQSGLVRMQSAPFFFKAMPHFNIQKLRRVVRRHVRLHGVRAVFFDYIKTPESATANTKEWMELGLFAFGLKTLAADERIPIVSAVQLNREAVVSFKAEGDVDSDSFGGSDRISHAITVGMVLRRPNKDERDGWGVDEENYRVLRVTDNRNGPTNYKGLCQLEGSIIRITELKRYHA